MISKRSKNTRSAETDRWRKGRSQVTKLAFCAWALPLSAGCAGSTDDTTLASETQDLQAGRLRDHIAQQVGGLENLMVPPDDASIPLPPKDPTRPGRYDTTEAKRYLGKMLFHDPVRTARININTMVPLDLPPGTAFGGTIDDSNVEPIVDHEAPGAQPDERDGAPAYRLSLLSGQGNP